MLSIRNYSTCNFRKPKGPISHYNSIIRVCYTYRSKLVRARNVLNLGNQTQLVLSKGIREFHTLSCLLNYFDSHLLIFLKSFPIEGEGNFIRACTGMVGLKEQLLNFQKVYCMIFRVWKVEEVVVKEFNQGFEVIRVFSFQEITPKTLDSFSHSR